MAEHTYTYENIIINPSKEGIESLIGKEVYFHNNPYLCLDYANKKSTDHLGVLAKIRKNSVVPFTIEQGNTVHEYTCIIEKKEEPKPMPKFIPFKSAEEFINVYDSTNYSVKNGTVENKLLYYGGIWLRNKNDDSMYMVIEIWKDGVFIGSDRLKTKWEELFNKYTFLDGSPCGKEDSE